MIVVFAGAGASKAVSADAYPTTVEFFQKLPPTVVNDALFTQILAYLRHRGERPESWDIEQVLWVLEELRLFLDQAKSANNIAGWLLEGGRLGSLHGSQYNLSPMMSSAAQVSSMLYALVGSINRQVYEWYSKLPDDASLEASWAPVIRELLQAGERLEIFTTNYDLVFEAVAEVLSREPALPRINIGHTTGLQRRLDQTLWRTPTKTSLSAPGGLLTKLHGSVDWSRRDSDIFISDPYFKGSDERHVILYPGFKGLPDKEPFSQFHNYFEAAVAAASGVLFVGFAFRDQYLNAILKRATPPRIPIVVIDKAKVLANVPFQEKRFSHMKVAFDATTGLDAVRKLLDSK